MTGSRTTRPRSGSARPGRPGHRLTARPARRLRAVFGVAVILLGVLGLRLVQLQGLDGAAYAKRAELQRQQARVLPASRGAIVDRNGIPLAMSVDSRTIFADPGEIRTSAAATELAYTLAPMLGLSPEDLLGKLQRKTRYVVLAKNVQPSVARAVTATLARTKQVGIGTEPGSLRVYPNGSLAASLLGFVPSGPGTGAGVERASNATLAGHDGAITAEFGAGGPEIPAGAHAERAPVPGSTLELTIDRDIQWAAQQAITAQVKAVAADSGTAIVMNPRTGELLAIATAPTFDPNAAGKPAFAARGNPAVSEVYEPGSVNKVITVAGALQEAKVTPETAFRIPGSLHLGDRTYHDAETHGTLHYTTAGILAKSSNIGTIEISQRLGRAKLYHYLRGFGFGASTGSGIPAESRGILPPDTQWNGSQRYTIAFGQGIGVTALQVASVYATLANGGVRVDPTVVRATIGPDGTATPRPRPATRQVVDAAVAQQVRDMLEAVTGKEGTAKAAQLAGYRVAGKTGTAQRPNPVCHCYRGGGYTASFVGFAPADNPQLLVEVILQNPRNGHFGGTVAAPVFRTILSFALKSLKIPPTGTRPPTMRLLAP